jgi:hypothetical protein
VTRTLALAMAIGISALAGNDERMHPASSRLYGAVSGKVEDLQGTPVGNAKVGFDIADRPTGRTRSVRTDSSGYFEVLDLAPGNYELHASKEQDDYPDTLIGFFADDAKPPPRVRVEAGKMVSGVRIRLGAKAARVTGSVLDATTGAAVRGAQITLRRKDADYWISFAPRLGDGSFETFVPAGKPFTMAVSAHGYQTWQPTDAVGKVIAWTLTPGSRKKVVIRMKTLSLGPAPLN